VITDNDDRERKAIQQVWQDIHLLLCTFHTQQSWTNMLHKCLPVPKESSKEEHKVFHHIECKIKELLRMYVITEACN
jgi:hypothetical protein